MQHLTLHATRHRSPALLGGGALLAGLALTASSLGAQAPQADSKAAAAQKIMDRTGTTLERVLDFEVVARLQLDGGEIHFVDETVDGEFGFGILELGSVDLGRFYEREATALEIYLALAPEGSAIPDTLYRAHDLARSFDPSIPEQPRDFHLLDSLSEGRATEKAVSYVNWAKSTNNCWTWGGSNSYDPISGNQDGHYSWHHDFAEAQYYFNLWSGIIDAGSSDYSDAHEENGNGGYNEVEITPWGKQRAMAMCVTHAEVQPMYELRDCAPGGDAANSILYWARLRGESSTSTWYSSQAVVLDAYGEGARYKSQSTNSRRYALEVWDKSPPNEGCKEHFHVLYRNRNYINGGGGGGGLIPK